MVHSPMSPHFVFEPTHRSPFHALPHPQQFQSLAHSHFWNISNPLIPNCLRTLPKNTGVYPLPSHFGTHIRPSLSSAHHFSVDVTTITPNLECGAPAPPLTNKATPTNLRFAQNLARRADYIYPTITASISNSRLIHKQRAITLRQIGLNLDNPKSSANIPMLSV